MKKIVDGKGRLFGTISVIDLIVIIVVVILAGAAYMKFHVMEKTDVSVKTSAVTYDFTVKSVRDTAVKLFKTGDTIYDKSGNAIGTIKDIKSQDSTIVSSLADGTYKVCKVDDRYDVTLAIEAQCSKSNGRYYVSRTFELNVNSENTLHTKYNLVNGTITDING